MLSMVHAVVVTELVLAVLLGGTSLSLRQTGRPTAIARSAAAGLSMGSVSNVPQIPPLDQTAGRKVALMVEPTPFTHVSGYSNRFKEMLRFLKAGGDEAEVITPDDTVDRPADFLGMPINYVPGFRLPLYRQVQLTVDIDLSGLRALQRFKPDVIHAVSSTCPASTTDAFTTCHT